jgi:hypothetical protein
MMSNSALANGGATLFFTTLLIHAGFVKSRFGASGRSDHDGTMVCFFSEIEK